MKETKAVLEAIEQALKRGLAVEKRPHLVGGPAPPPAEGVSEEEFLQEVQALARRNGWRLYHTRDSRKSTAGFPDLVMVRAGRIVAAELKVGGNRPTAAQQAWLDDLRLVADVAPNVRVFLWYPADWPQIVEVLT